MQSFEFPNIPPEINAEINKYLSCLKCGRFVNDTNSYCEDCDSVKVKAKIRKAFLVESINMSSDTVSPDFCERISSRNWSKTGIDISPILYLSVARLADTLDYLIYECRSSEHTKINCDVCGRIVCFEDSDCDRARNIPYTCKLCGSSDCEGYCDYDEFEHAPWA
jgi:hypothetical protein